MIKNIKDTALRAAKAAGRMLIPEYRRFDRADVRLKSHHEIVTKADLKSEEVIIREIRKSFPSHGILSEEKGSIESESDYLWIIDPIDGTTNFSMHNPLWAVSIGVACRGEIVCGIVYAPILDEIYLAESGKGARLGGKKIGVSRTREGKVLNAFCHGRDLKHIKRAIKYYSAQKTKDLDCRQLGSASLELAFVAAGRLESIVIPGVNSWDVAAGVLLVSEAGGRVTDFKGHAWTLESIDMAASNGAVHGDLLGVLRGI